VLVRTDSADAGSGEAFLQKLRQQAQPALPRGATLIGPLPSPMQRRAGKFRTQLLLKAKDRATAQGAATLLVNLAQELPGRSKLNWTIDIDPQDGV
jgi:primosomal protein N' (replication factor Y)